MKSFSIFFSALAVALLPACRAPDTSTALRQPTSHDGRGQTACPYWTKQPNVELCSPSLLRLVTRPEDYDGRRLKVVGYLQKVDSVFVLCPGAGLCDRNDLSAAVQLPSDQLFEQMLAEESVTKITVIGIFQSSTRGRLGQVAGIFMSVDEAFEPGP